MLFITILQDLETSVNSTHVIFSTTHKGQPIIDGKIITFSDTKANVGNGMDSATGVFTVPVTGIYEFSFSAYFYHFLSYTGVIIYKNGEYQFRIHDQNLVDNDFPHYHSIGNTWTMSLLQNDQIHLKLEGNPLAFNPNYVSEYVWFNGQLLMKQ